MTWRKLGSVRRRASVVLNASGAGSVSFDVWSANHRWLIQSVVVKAAGAKPTLFPQVTITIGGSSDGLSAGGAWTGNQVTFHGEYEITAGDTLTINFASGTAGTLLTAIIDGDNYLWR